MNRPEPLAPAIESLATRALTYACGEMAQEEARAFEEELAGNQLAREALVEAVAIVSPLLERPLSPSRRWRTLVRRRLRQAIWAATPASRPEAG